MTTITEVGGPKSNKIKTTNYLGRGRETMGSVGDVMLQILTINFTSELSARYPTLTHSEGLDSLESSGLEMYINRSRKRKTQTQVEDDRRKR